MAPMFGRLRQRRHAADVRERFVTETVEALHDLHRRVWVIEEHIREQQATNRELERHTARAEAEASVARLELREFLERQVATESIFSVDHSTELLDDLLPVRTSTTSADPIDRAESDAGVAYRCFFPTPEGYELVERSGAVPTVGSIMDLGEHGRGEVVKVGRSPLPDDVGRCVYVVAVAARPDGEWTPEEESVLLAVARSR
jgi:hypothetical protein